MRLVLPYKLIDLGEKTYTVERVKKAGINEDDIVKTLVIRVNNDFIALALRGNDRIDFKKVRAEFGSKSELASPDEVLKTVGVPVGAVCPILIGIPLYFDQKILNLDKVHMGSGDLNYGLEMSFSDFIKAVGDFTVLPLT